MTERALTDKSVQPTESALKDVLGETYAYYNSLLALTEKFDHTWTFYKGWSLKVFDKKKALFYIAPYHSLFIVRMAIRENERADMLLTEELEFIHDALLNAEKYSEGYKMEFSVTDKEAARNCEKFIEELINMR